MTMVSDLYKNALTTNSFTDSRLESFTNYGYPNGLQWTRHTENSSHVTNSLFHKKVNSSQRLSQGEVNSPHGDLVTLEAKDKVPQCRGTSEK